MGVRVIELSQGWPGPLCGKLLMELGATVLKIEPPTGDRIRQWGLTPAQADIAFDLLHAGKEVRRASSSGDGLGQAIADADVVLIDGGAPGFGDAGQFSTRTIVCKFSPYRSPEFPTVPGSDLILQAGSGLMATTGESGRKPLRAGTELGAAMGALYGTIGVLAALIERERSGAGQRIDVTLHDCLVSALTNFASRVFAGHEALGRLGNQGPNTAPWNLFETADHDYVFIIAGSDPTFRRLCTVMGAGHLLHDPRFATDAARRGHWTDINDVVSSWTRTLRASAIVGQLRAAGVPVSAVHDTKQVLDDPHFAFRGLSRTVDVEGGTTRITTTSPLGMVHEVSSLQQPRRNGSRSDRQWAQRQDRSQAQIDGPLAGVRVLDLGNLTAGPFCCRILGNLGAEVVKVEPPGGESGRSLPPMVEGESVYFHITNTDKRSMVVDLHEPAGQAAVADLAALADILVENQAPGALAAKNLGPSELHRVNPALIYTSVSGFGHDGPLGQLRAYDTVVQAGGGLMSLTGEPDGQPLKTGISTADVLGALGAAAGSLAALYGRAVGRTGGAHLDVALYDLVVWSTHMAWPAALSGAGIGRYGNGHWCHTPHGGFETSDGTVAVACETDDEWRALFEVLRAADEVVAPVEREMSRYERRKHIDAIERSVGKYCGARTTGDVVAELQGAGVSAGPVLEVADALASNHTIDGRLIVPLKLHDGRMVTTTELPLRFSRTPGRVRDPAPMLDADAGAIRASLATHTASAPSEPQMST
jgi:crotonobetainyl-CoA:carnitine CoA-transferase CaiB-like acyl-CoA transferase